MLNLNNVEYAMPVEGLVNLMAADKPLSFDGKFMGEGARNATLASMAGFLVRKHGLSGEALAAQLSIMNEGQEVPLPAAEVWQIAQSITNYKDGLLPAFDEVAVSRAFARHVSRDIRFAAGMGWMFYDGAKWCHDTTGKLVQESCKRFVELIKEQYRLALNDSNEEGRESAVKASKEADKLATAAKIKKVYELAASDDLIICKADAFDQNPDLLNCKNGTLDLKTGLLRPHDPADMITKVANVEYDAKASCPTFDRVLNEVLPDEHAAFLLRYLGYAMKAQPIEQAFLIAFGPGLNGKSTIINAVGDVLGDYTVRAAPESFCGGASKSIRNDLARMVGGRMVVTAELPLGVPLDVALVKAMTGGEKLTVRFLHKEFFEFAPTFALVMVTNYLPVVNGNDDALHRRVLLLPFKIRIVKDKVDKSLPHKLADETAGILNRLLEGLADYEMQGLGVPANLQKMANEYLSNSNLLQQFLSDRFVLNSDERVPSLEVYRRYKWWCAEQGYKPLSNGVFNSEFKKLNGITFAKTNRGNEWRGLSLNDQGV